MKSENVFVYVVCGDDEYIKTLHTSLRFLKKYSKNRIVVVTDLSRNNLNIKHKDVINIETPKSYTHHEASIYLKTGVHQFVDLKHNYCYLDTDVIAVSSQVDNIFSHFQSPISFAPDLTVYDTNVARFSPWAMNCNCLGFGITQSCHHLTQAIEEKFDLKINNNWLHWNGGVFLFNRQSTNFMQTWHDLTLDAFNDPYWKTRDQHTLITTIWKMGLQNHTCLPQEFNFIADVGNTNLVFDKKEGYALHKSLPKIHPYFLHLYSHDLTKKGWSLKRDLEEEFIRRTKIENKWLRNHFAKHGYINGLPLLCFKIRQEVKVKIAKLRNKIFKQTSL